MYKPSLVVAMGLVACHAGSAKEPEENPCPGAVQQCIDLSRQAESSYSEASLVLLEGQGYCGALVSTYPLATAKSTWITVQTVARLVNVCYERDRLPFSEFLACHNGMKSADTAIGASINRYSDLASRRMMELTSAQAMQLNRAISTALDGNVPNKQDECFSPSEQEATPDEPETPAPVLVPVTTPS